MIDETLNSKIQTMKSDNIKRDITILSCRDPLTTTETEKETSERRQS